MMALQKGPGEGYGAAKDEALALDPTLVCKRHVYHAPGGTPLKGWVVWRGDKGIGSAAIARDAWAKALDFLTRVPA